MSLLKNNDNNVAKNQNENNNINNKKTTQSIYNGHSLNMADFRCIPNSCRYRRRQRQRQRWWWSCSGCCCCRLLLLFCGGVASVWGNGHFAKCVCVWAWTFFAVSFLYAHTHREILLSHQTVKLSYDGAIFAPKIHAIMACAMLRKMNGHGDSDRTTVPKKRKAYIYWN